MIYRTKFKIGEFSKLMQVTVKTLRLYEQKALLLPDEVTNFKFCSVNHHRTITSLFLISIAKIQHNLRYESSTLTLFNLPIHSGNF